LVQEAYFELHFLVSLDELVGVLVGCALWDADDLGFGLLLLEVDALPLFLTAKYLRYR